MSDSITVGSYSLRKRGGAASSPTGPAPVRVGNAATTSKREGADKAGIDNGTTSSPPSSRQAQPAKESDTALSESTLSPVGDSPGRRELEREPEGGRPPLAARKPTNKRPKREFSGDSTETEVDDEDEDDEYVEGGGASRGGTSSRKKSTKQRRTSIDHTSPTTRHPPVGHQAQLSTHSPINHRKSLPQPGRHPSRRSGEYSDQASHNASASSSQSHPPDHQPAPVLKQLRYLPYLVKGAPQVLDFARREAAQNLDLQAECQRAVEAAINQLPDRQQRDSLCLILNRYSAYCASPYIAIEAFPLTPDKVFLFLARTLDHQIGRTLLSILPQPTTYPLPVVNHPQFPPDPAEGKVITRALVHCWIEALTYVQGSTVQLWPGLQARDGLLRDHLGTQELEGLVESGERWAAVGTRQVEGGLVRGGPMMRDGGPPAGGQHPGRTLLPQGYNGHGETGYLTTSRPMSRPTELSRSEMEHPPRSTPLGLHHGQRAYPLQVAPRPHSRPMIDGGWGPHPDHAHYHGPPKLAPLHQPLPQHQATPILPPIQMPPVQPSRPRERIAPHSSVPSVPATRSPPQLSERRRSDPSTSEREAALGGARELVRLASNDEAQPSGELTATETSQSRAVGDLPAGPTSACDVLAIAAAAVAEQKRVGPTEGVAAERKPTPVIDPSLLEAATGVSSQESPKVSSHALRLDHDGYAEMPPPSSRLTSVARASSRSLAPVGLAAPVAAPPVLTRIVTDVQLSAHPHRRESDLSPAMLGVSERPDSRNTPVAGRGEVAPVARKIRPMPQVGGEYAGVEPRQGYGRPSSRTQQGGMPEGPRTGAPEYYRDWHAHGPVGQAPPMADYYLASRYPPALPGPGTRMAHDAGRLHRPGSGAWSSQQIAEQLYRHTPAEERGAHPHAFEHPMPMPMPVASQALAYSHVSPGPAPAYHQQLQPVQQYGSYSPSAAHNGQYGGPIYRPPVPMPSHGRGGGASGHGYAFEGEAYGPPTELMGPPPMGGHARMASMEQRGEVMSGSGHGHGGGGYAGQHAQWGQAGWQEREAWRHAPGSHVTEQGRMMERGDGGDRRVPELAQGMRASGGGAGNDGAMGVGEGQNGVSRVVSE